MPLRRKDIGFVTKQITVVDQAATGELMRKSRLQIGLSLRAMAKHMGISAMYLSDLERGRRNWNEYLMSIWFEAAFPNKD